MPLILPGTFGLPSGEPRSIWLRSTGNGTDSSTAGTTVTWTHSAMPLWTSSIVMIGGVENGGNSSWGQYNMTQTGYVWSASPMLSHVNNSYPVIPFDIGKRNPSVAPGTSCSIYHEGKWSGWSTLEFAGLKGELVDFYTTWANAYSISGALQSAVKERGLLLLAVACNHTGGSGPTSISGLSGGLWSAMVNHNWNHAFAYCYSPTVGAKPTITFNHSSRSTIWTLSMFLLR